MTNKKTFGAFIKSKRMEKNYSQRELAEMLFVTEGAISKWERGISYPDISLITDICSILEISEHEFVTASTDTTARKLKQEARKFRVIRNTWFWAPTILYAITLLTCFICNLVVNHTLSWFFIVLAAVLCAYTFLPTVTSLFKANRLLVFSVSTYLSVCLLLFTCAIYTDGLSWFITSCIGVLMGYVLLFAPMLLSKTSLFRYKYVISFATTCILTFLLLLNIYIWHPFKLVSAILMTGYGFAPVILCAVICTFHFDGYLKAGICTALSTVMCYCANHVANALFGSTNNPYQMDFNNWEQYLNGNVLFITFILCLFVSAIFTGIGFLRISKNKKR